MPLSVARIPSFAGHVSGAICRRTLQVSYSDSFEGLKTYGFQPQDVLERPVEGGSLQVHAY